MTCECPPGPGPSLAGFTDFVFTDMSVPTEYLPNDSPFINTAYCTALRLVNRQIQEADPYLYTRAVYNLGGSLLINYAQDPQPIEPYPEGSEQEPPVGFFGWTRQQLGLLGNVAGVVQATADESTSTSLLVPKQIEGFTIANLQQLKDPWGRAYLGIAQSVGSLWGLT